VSRTNIALLRYGAGHKGGFYGKGAFNAPPIVKPLPVRPPYIPESCGYGVFKGGQTYMNKSILRGDLYYADLNPVVGSEQGGTRPVLIIQNDIGNKHSPTTIVAAVTSREEKPLLPTHCPLSMKSGLERDSVALLEQIRTIDKRRLREYVGAAGKDEMRGVDRALALSVGLRGRAV
jgi:mRNA interferase MazF